jgi:hypothetical protein
MIREPDFPSMDDTPEVLSRNRTIVCHASKEALGPKTDVILGRFGYKIFSPETFSELRASDPSLTVDLLLVEDRRLGEAVAAEEEDGERAVPIVLLTGKHGATGADPRIVGAVKRPAGLHDLYRLLQQIFEDTPRSTPRVATQLLARCAEGERSWESRVLSLSENGCLIRSPEAIQLGQRIQLEFSLPGSGRVCLEAEATYQLLPDVGLVFNGVPPARRKTLERFVIDSSSCV